MARLKKAGFSGRKILSVAPNKIAYRRVHRLARRHEIDGRRGYISKWWQRHKESFASGAEIVPDLITPRLEFIRPDDAKKNELFRLARLYWSLPYSQGYGRRIRFLLWDDHIGKIMAIGGLQSPPLDFAIRDRSISYPDGRKTWFVNQMMDAYTVGAIPPYGKLLAGKLAAMTLGSNQLREVYRRRYSGRFSEIANRQVPGRLIAVSTTSAYGRSAQYDRLATWQEKPLLRSLGIIEQTFGSYHFNGVYPMLRGYLERHRKARQFVGFGTGPRVRWQVIRQGLRAVGLPERLLQHHVPREAFMVSNISNLQEYCAGVQSRPRWIDRPFAKLSESWTQRWLLPRWERMQQDATRLQEFRQWRRQSLVTSIFNA